MASFFGKHRLASAAWMASFAAQVLFASVTRGEPTVSAVSLRGLQVGVAQRWVVDGQELGEGLRLLSDVPLDKAELISANGARAEFEVVPAATCKPGVYVVRVAGSTGVSAPLAIAFDGLRSIPATPELGALPVAVSDVLGGDQRKSYKFAGKSGETVRVEIDARRLGAGFDPVVRVKDDQGRQIAFSPPSRALSGDAGVTAKLPRDGVYSIEVHDRLLRAGAPGHFRLKVGAFRSATSVHPLGLAMGAATKSTVFSTDGVAEAAVDVAGLSTGGRAAPLALEGGWTAPAPQVFVSPYPEVLEQPQAAGVLQEIGPAPVSVSGVVAADAEIDYYVLQTTPGQRIRLEIAAGTAGSPLDAVLFAHTEQGAGIAAIDDTPGAVDPSLEFEVPAGATKVRVGAYDMRRRGGPDFNYRLTIRAVGAPDYAIESDLDRVQVPAGGVAVWPMRIVRKGYEGPIALKFDGLPAGVAVAGDQVPAGATQALVTLARSTESAGAGATVRAMGTVNDDPTLIRFVRSSERGETKSQPWLREELAVGAVGAGPIAIAWNGAEADRLAAGGVLQAPVKITRAPGVVGKTRLRIVTTQPMPKKTVRVNNQDQLQDDPERAIRLDADVLAAPEQLDAIAPIRTPLDAPATTFDVAIAADLLGADDKTPVYTAYSAARRLAVDVPYKIIITGPTTLEAKTGAGEAGKLAGTIVRSPGFDGPIRLSLGNVPSQTKPNAMIVRPGQTDFAFPVTFVFGSPTGALADVQVLASADVTRSGVGSPLPVRLNVNVTAGEQPTAEPPLELFEDDAEITGQVPEGGGQIGLEATDRLTGARSLRVTPPQRYAGRIERLNMPIRENPGPGEYRYIRFAWKKKGGAKLCLQIGHDNTFGPAGDKLFRYTAADADCGGPALKVSDKLPTEGFEIVTRDLYADFGAFTLTSFAFAPLDGEYALFDHIYLGRYAGDFELIPLEPAKK